MMICKNTEDTKRKARYLNMYSFIEKIIQLIFLGLAFYMSTSALLSLLKDKIHEVCDDN